MSTSKVGVMTQLTLQCKYVIHSSDLTDIMALKIKWIIKDQLTMVTNIFADFL